ncbi:MAG: cytochrome c peroxidase [Salibacteraceae bacterium]
MNRTKLIALSTIFTLIGSGILVSSCEKDRVNLKGARLSLPETPYEYLDVDLKGKFAREQEIFNRKSSNDGVTLGRVLFYDPALSLGNNTSCSSCHEQSMGFADGKAKSDGFFNGKTRRNSLGVSNLATSTSLFWDGRASSVEQQVLMPIQDHIEMGFDDLTALEKKLGSIDYYPELFKKAFGTEDISSERIADALAQFVGAIWSVNSYNDEMNQAGISNLFPDNPTLNSAQRGKLLFEKTFQCGMCHRTADSDYGSHFGSANIGLDVEYEDNGVGELETENGFKAPKGYFKIPSLRNVAHTAPYMHDGRFATLEEVVEFYNSGIQNHRSLSFPLFEQDENQNRVAPKRYHMTDEQKRDLIAFFHSLTDYDFLTDKRYSNPFVEAE